ncbi:hypothetical protein FisN_4Lh379 [Fistulifera solaris]|uniref:Nuclear pore complex protein Nup160 n=1 Tax=Fistulifera solaris TaxID=1519565 RepID=A0A1Z5JZR5_FISSO|nr:hypothetical protein FisN_4Lh379 [Fistulifera solaris]|eukprot:GAX19399.1 hypothetical protein FisN_4Lh379 [Fistulifera solaris]
MKEIAIEVPVVFPSLEVGIRRYAVNEISHTLRLVSNDSSLTLYNSPLDNFLEDDLSRLRGMASVSSLANCKVVTSPLGENPSVLVVTLLPDDGSASSMIQIDLGSQASCFINPIKVQAVPWDQSDAVGLIVATEEATILRIKLDLKSLEPHEDIILWKAGEELAEKLESVTRAHLNSSMVAVLSHARVLLALNPFLLAGDLETRETCQWSKLKCEERMKERASVLFRYTSVFRASAFAINETFFDMQPVSALAVADNDARHVFSLHTDGIVRHWTLEDSNEPLPSMLPWAVTEPSVQGIPRGELWDGNDSFAISMTAKRYQDNYALAIHIRTRIPDNEVEMEEDTDIELLESNESLMSRGYANLFVLEGPLDGDSARKEIDMRLQTPAEATSVLAMSFRDNGIISLSVVFQSTLSECSIHAEFKKDGNSMMRSEPYAQSEFLFLENLATRERQQIEKLTFMSELTFTRDSDGPVSVEDRIQHIDQRFLSFLFRPSHPRGTGTVLPPLPFYIRRGLMKMDRTLQSYPSNNSVSIELETLQAVQAWRRKDASRMQPNTPVKHSFITGNSSSISIYDSVNKSSRQESEQEAQDVVELEQIQVDGDWRIACQDHESRWRSFLSEIWEQECRERVQLCFAAISANSDKAVVVRAGSISIIRCAGLSQSNSLIDEVSWKAFNAMECSNEYSALAEFECIACDCVRRGKLGIDLDSVSRLEIYLAEVCRKASPLLDTLLTANEVSEIEKIEFAHEDAQRIKRLPLIQLLSSKDISISGASNGKGVLSAQQRLAAAGLTIRTLDILRRVFLGRLVVLKTVTGDFAVAALRAYLKAVTGLYVSAQRVNMRFVFSGPRPLQSLAFGSQRPIRMPFEGLSSVLEVYGMHEKTVSIDSLLIYLSDFETSPTSPAFTTSVTQLTVDAIHRYMCDANADGSPFNDVRLPELASIPPSTGNVTDEPKLALRLLAVSMSLPNSVDSRIVDNKRKHVFAMCLLTASRTANDSEAVYMVERAVVLLAFDTSDMGVSMQNLQTLCHHLAGQYRHASVLQDYIMEAIHCTLVDGEEGVEKLWLSLFSVSILVRDWKTAMKASISCSDAQARRERIERLVRAMVDSGALATLCDMSLLLDNSVEEEGLIEALQRNNELYSIAVETFQENSCRDHYSHLAIEPEPLSDYFGALYSLHVSQGKWKNAAHSMHVRYKRAQIAFLSTTDILDLSPQALDRREQLIIEDLVLGSSGCRLALNQVAGTQGDFLAPSMGSKALLVGSGNDVAFHTKDELATRAVWKIALKNLYEDLTPVGKAFATSALAKKSITSDTLKTCVDTLFACGYYHDGLIVAYQQKKLLQSKPCGRDVLVDALGHLLCTYLVPLASGELVPTTRPTLSQLQSAHETITGLLTTRPPVLALRSGIFLSGLYANAVKCGANALCHSLIVLYTTPENNIAKEVAEAFLFSEIGAAQLPAWLEYFLTYGNADIERPGLFAKRSTKDDSLYSGDPNALLSLYMKRGMFIEACRLVSSVLSGSGSWGRQTKASSRLPERGDIDYVPHRKIDLLWNSIELEVGANAQSVFLADLLAARSDMERALEKHFELLNISESGLVSARTLA